MARNVLKSLMSMLSGLRIGRSGINLAVLDPAFDGRQSDGQRATPPPEGFAFIHLFAAKFENAAAARAFCYDTPTKNTPEQITRELSGAFINTQFVEVVSENIAARLNEFMNDSDSINVVTRLGANNTVIIITEDAFGGFPFVVHSTDTLTYLGKFTVPV